MKIHPSSERYALEFHRGLIGHMSPRSYTSGAFFVGAICVKMQMDCRAKPKIPLVFEMGRLLIYKGLGETNVSKGRNPNYRMAEITYGVEIQTP